jgi:hypothetical protein
MNARKIVTPLVCGALLGSLVAMGSTEAVAQPGPGPRVLTVVDLGPASLTMPKPRTHPETSAAGKPTDESRIPANGIEYVTDLRPSIDVGRNVTLAGASTSAAPAASAPGRTRILRQGVRIAGTTNGCSFNGTVRMSMPASVSVDEIDRDSELCLSLVQVTVTAPDGDLTVPSSASMAVAPPAPGRKAATSLRRTLSLTANTGTGTYVAKTRSQTREVLYGVLNATTEVNTQINVFNDQPGYAPTNASWWSNWLSASGWSKTYDSGNAYFASSGNNANIYDYVKFRNGTFGRIVCGILSGATYADHYPTQIYAYGGHQVTYSTNTTWYGSCSGLLRGNDTFYLDNAVVQ